MKIKEYSIFHFIKACGISVPVLLLLLLFSGCTPKRVINGRAESSPATETVRKTVPAEERPSTEVKIKEEQHIQSDPVESLELGIRAAILARGQLDKPYCWAAEGPEKFDCSGLVFYVFGSLGVSMPRVSRDQAKVGLPVNKSQLQPGDLVFFITENNGINHVGIYVGDSRFVHAPSGHGFVSYDSLDNPWWRKAFQFGRRIQG